MNISDFFQGNPGFFATLKYAWSIYKENFKSIAKLVLIIALPIYLILYFSFGNILFLQLPVEGSSTYYSQTRSMYSALIFLAFVSSVIDFCVIYFINNKIIGQESNLKQILFKVLGKYLKIFVTVVIALMVVAIPSIITSILAAVGTQLFGKSSLMAIFLLPFGLVSVLAFIYFIPTFFFIPLVCLLRDKWMVPAIKSSWTLVHKNWWRVFIFSIGLGIFNFAVLKFFAFFGFFALMAIIALLAQKIVVAYGDIVYLLFMLKYENRKGLAPKQQPE